MATVFGIRYSVFDSISYANKELLPSVHRYRVYLNSKDQFQINIDQSNKIKREGEGKGEGKGKGKYGPSNKILMELLYLLEYDQKHI